MGKKGGFTATQLGIIILIVAGFAILLFLFYQIGFTGRIDKEVSSSGAPKNIEGIKSRKV